MPQRTAEERGHEMLLIPIGKLPPFALDFGKKLCHESGGGCLEVLLTAWTIYAQCVEGLECSDDLYQARPQDWAWFKERLTP
jgi:hypothetical protein